MSEYEFPQAGTKSTVASIDSTMCNHLKLIPIAAKLLPRVSYDFSPAELASRKDNESAVQRKSKRILRQDSQSAERKFNKLLSHEERVEILHLHFAHKMNPRKIGILLGMKYSTVRAIVLSFQKHGRVNKLLTYSAKVQLLKLRKSKQKPIGFQAYRIYKRKNRVKGPKLLLKYEDQNDHHDTDNDYFQLNIIPQNYGWKTENIDKPQQQSAPATHWMNFTKVTEDVEKCEYEYRLREDKAKKMWCQLSNVFSGTMKSFNITDKIEACNYPQFLNLPNP